jgi:hypothetical protein
MPQRQQHRGKHAKDDRLFAEKWVGPLRRATIELSYLLSQGYAHDAALKLVGDHHQLEKRQRRAVLRAACSDESLQWRTAHRVRVAELVSQTLAVDGFNLLITVESILSHGVLLRGRDGCIRDMASVHGSYRKVEETVPAIRLIGQTFHDLSVSRVRWFLDAPVSNSGRLATILREQAAENDWDFDVEVIGSVDQTLADSDDIVISSDAWILDRATRWANVTDAILDPVDKDVNIIDLRE